jgi:hypothetical protein
MTETDRSSKPGSLLEAAATPVLFVPRLFLGAVRDIRSIAEATRTLASLADYLASIEQRVTSMDAEVREMRQGVDRLHPEVTAMRESVEPLEGHLRGVGSLARLASRLPGGRAKGRPAAPDAASIEAAELELAADDDEADVA